MTGWMVEKVSRSGWRMKWRRLRPVTTAASVIAERAAGGDGSRSHRTGLRGAGTSGAGCRGRGRRRVGGGGPAAVLAGRGAGQLQEDIVQGGPAQPDVA